MLYLYPRQYGYAGREGYSLADQKLKLEERAASLGMRVVDTFQEEGASGKNIDDRPKFKKMMPQIENDAENVGYVLVADLSRFGRNMAERYCRPSFRAFCLGCNRESCLLREDCFGAQGDRKD